MSELGALQDIEQPIELIYQALDDERCWKLFLECLIERLKLTFATIVVAYPRSHSLSWSHYAGVSEEFFREYLTVWMNDDPWVPTQWPSRAPVGEFLRSENLVSDEELYRNDAFLKYFQPIGYHYGGGVVLARTEFQTASVGFARATHFGPLTEDEISWFRRVTPHLMRAVALQGRIGRLEAERTSLLAYFNTVAVGILLVNRKGDILLANAPAESILEKRDGLTRENRQLRAVDKHEQAQLLSILEKAGTTLPDIKKEAGTIAITRPDSAPLLLHASIANPTQINRVGLESPDVVLWIVDPTEQRRIDATALQELFGLTKAEVKLCVDLAYGHSVAEIAELVHVSVHTVRSHLKHVLEKTGVSRQSELVALTLRVGSVPRSAS